MISSTGCGLREAEDEWDFPRIERWLAYCAKHPPLQAMVEAYMGFDSAPMRVTEKNFTEFVGMLQMDSKTSGSA